MIDSTYELPNGQILPNRIAKSAMSERLSKDGSPVPELVHLYEQWAAGGTGLLITGNVMVDRRHLGESGNVVVEDDRDLEALRAWAQAAQSGGGRVWMQINHPGRQSPRHVNRQPVAPSAVSIDIPGAFVAPRELEIDEVWDIVERFASTAEVAQRAGFDGVQIHGAHGYLVSQFLSPRTNQREDMWGGDDTRRRRFLLELVRAIVARTGPDFAVGVKLNSADFQKGGFSEEASLAVVKALEAEGIDLIEVSGGTYESAVMFEETQPQHDSSIKREAFFLDFAHTVRANCGLPILVTGGFRTLDGMEDALASGATDLIGMARPLAAEPDLPQRLMTRDSTAARPIKLATGHKTLDALIQGGWYQLQIKRMAAGKAPDPSLWRVCAVLQAVAG